MRLKVAGMSECPGVVQQSLRDDRAVPVDAQHLRVDIAELLRALSFEIDPERVTLDPQIKAVNVRNDVH